MTAREAPRTEAGRAAWDRAAGLGPKIDTITVTAREWRETILAIEREAAATSERNAYDKVRARLYAITGTYTDLESGHASVTGWPEIAAVLDELRRTPA